MGNQPWYARDSRANIHMTLPEMKSIHRNASTKRAGLWNKASRSTVALRIVNDIIAKKLFVPCTTRWNLFYNAVARISEIPVAELNTISSQLQLKCISEREHQVLKEYCVVMKPLTVALDTLQGEDNCFYGTLLPTLETLMPKTLEFKKTLAILDGLPKAVFQVRAALLFCIYI